MTNDMKIGFCGVGNMAGAILNAALSAGILRPEQVYAYNPTKEKLAPFVEKGIVSVSSNREVVECCDLIFLGFKPQKFDEVAGELRGLFQDRCVVSMLAGVSQERLKSALDAPYVVRVMPNTPMVVAAGCTVIARPDGVPQVFSDLIFSIFRASGTAVVVEEDEINRTIPLSSSSPAFFFRFLRAMVDAGVKSGIARDTAFSLACETMHGVCHLLRATELSLDELIAQVTSPGGTTLAALTAFDEYHFEDMIDTAFQRAIQRADELGRG